MPYRNALRVGAAALAGLSLLSTVAGAQQAGPLTRVDPDAAPALVSRPPARVAQDGNSSCISSCRAQYHQCLISTKGSPSCSAQQDACLRGCLRR